MRLVHFKAPTRATTGICVSSYNGNGEQSHPEPKRKLQSSKPSSSPPLSKKQEPGPLSPPIIEPPVPLAQAAEALPPSDHGPVFRPASFTTITAQDIRPTGFANLEEGVSKKILIAVDNSPESRAACEWALRNLVGPSDAVTIAQVVISLAGDAAPAAAAAAAAVAPERRRVRPSQVQEKLNQYKLNQAVADKADELVARRFVDLFKRINMAPSVRLVRAEWSEDGHSSMISHAVADQVMKLATEVEADALVITSQRVGPHGEHILGAAAALAAHRCPRPLLVLHSDAFSGTAPPSHRSLKIKDTSVRVARSVAPPGHLTHMNGHVSVIHPSGVASSHVSVPTGMSISSSGGGGAATHRRLMVALDRTEATVRAVQWALKNLYRRGDVLRLCHVIPAHPRGSPLRPGSDGAAAVLEVHGASASVTASLASSPEVQEAWTRDYETTCEFVRSSIAPLLAPHRIPWELDIVTEHLGDQVGSVGQAICELAEELDVAAIVTAAHHTPDPKELLMGSVSYWVQHWSPRAVAVIH